MTRRGGEAQYSGEALLQALSDGVWAVDAEGRVTVANRAAQEVLALPADWRGRNVRTLAHPAAGAGDLPLIRALDRGETVTHDETWVRLPSGAVVALSSSTALLKDDAGAVVGAVETFRDITALKGIPIMEEPRNYFKNIVGRNARMREIFTLIGRVAQTKSTVLIEGESGTGKELVAQAIHENSPRSHEPFVRVNCGALAEGVLESELFGHVKGAFTGAIANKLGRFELAHRGTIFLDEIGDMSLATQVKLLRVLQEGEFERVGGTTVVRVDVRVIAATNRELRERVQRELFREDLYYRLRVVPIKIPPLRERKDDLPLLIQHFMERFNRLMGKDIRGLSTKAREVLTEYSYPGNVRELENIVEHAFVCCSGHTILLEHLPKEILGPDLSVVERAVRGPDPLATMEKEVILRLLHESGWRYGECAAKLGVSRTTLWRKLKHLGITRGTYRRD